VATKKCTKCGKQKPLQAFHKNKSTPDGLQIWCRKCKAAGTKRAYQKNHTHHRAKQAEWNKANRAHIRNSDRARVAKDPDYYRRIQLRCKFGITVEDYDAMYAKQAGVCGICGKPETRKVKGTLCHLAVDHDHETGKIRGLLCSKCNRGIGLLQDDIQLLSKAVAWLTPSENCSQDQIPAP